MPQAAPLPKSSPRCIRQLRHADIIYLHNVSQIHNLFKRFEVYAKTGAVIDTRPHALRRVLVNLTDNALKFAGAAEIQVQTHTDQSLSLQVLDCGPGIAEGELSEVIKPFYRVESSRNRDTGGTGLGLAIAQQLTIALGGTLTLTNREGGGLCAQLKLPARTAKGAVKIKDL